jgi:hypothetical protein
MKYYISAMSHTGAHWFASATFPRFTTQEFDVHAPRLSMTNYLDEAMPYDDEDEANADFAAYMNVHPDLTHWRIEQRSP